MTAPIIFGDSHCRTIQRDTIFKSGRTAETAMYDADWHSLVSRAETASAVAIVLESNDIRKRKRQYFTPQRAANQVLDDLRDIKAAIPNENIFIVDLWRRTNETEGEAATRNFVNRALGKENVVRVSKLVKARHISADGVHLTPAGTGVVTRCIEDTIRKSQSGQQRRVVIQPAGDHTPPRRVVLLNMEQ